MAETNTRPPRPTKSPGAGKRWKFVNGKWKSVKKAGGGRTTVTAPFDRPYLTPAQIRRQAAVRAERAVESPEDIEERYTRRRAGAERIGKSFEEQLAADAERARMAAEAIGAAAGGQTGGALVVGSALGAQQRREAAPIYAAGRTAAEVSDIETTRSQEAREREQAYRQARTTFEEALREEEKQKQATRIEREAAAKAYGLDIAKLAQQDAQFAQRQANADRTYNLQVQKWLAAEDRLEREGQLDTLAGWSKVVDEAVAAMPKGKGKTWSGTLNFTDPNTDKPVKVDVSNAAGPRAGASKAESQAYWKRYLNRKGYEFEGQVGINLNRDARSANPAERAAASIDMLLQNGFTPSEVRRILMASTFGRMNARIINQLLSSGETGETYRPVGRPRPVNE